MWFTRSIGQLPIIGFGLFQYPHSNVENESRWVFDGGVCRTIVVQDLFRHVVAPRLSVGGRWSERALHGLVESLDLGVRIEIDDSIDLTLCLRVIGSPVHEINSIFKAPLLNTLVHKLGPIVRVEDTDAEFSEGIDSEVLKDILNILLLCVE